MILGMNGMATEEDTFDALKKTPYKIVHEQFTELVAGPHPLPVNKEVITAFLQKHGWEYGEFFKRWRE